MSVRQWLSFRSPVSKLLRFFCRSRDNWKAKCKAAKKENKSLKTRLTEMKRSRDRWKVRVRCSRKDPELETATPEERTKNRAGRSSRGAGRRPARVGRVQGGGS